MNKKIILILLGVVFLAIGCSKNIKEKEQGSFFAEKKKSEQTVDEKEKFAYNHEGFIDNDTYRVLIIRPSNAYYAESEVEKIAQEKTLISLRRVIQEHNGKITNSVDARLHQLVVNNGKLNKISENTNRTVYTYEVQKSGLKQQIVRIIHGL